MSEATVVTRRGWGPVAAAVTAAAILIGGTLTLWAYYGTTVFYEMILAGIALCL